MTDHSKAACVSCGLPIQSGQEWCPEPCHTDLRDSNNHSYVSEGMGVKRNTPEPGWQPRQDTTVADVVIVLALFVAPLIYLGVWALWLR